MIYLYNSVFDSLLIQINGKTISQNKVDFGCLDVLTTETQCQQSSNLVDLQLEERYAQDIYMYSTRNNQIQEKELIDKKLKFKGHSM